MTVHEFVEDLAKGKRSGLQFERMLFRLLNRHQELNGRPFLGASGADAFAPNGVAPLRPA